MGVLRDNYDVGERIGQGGFGVVNKATDKRDGRTVALKKLERDKNPERIEEEIRALKKLRKSPHKNIVRYIESFTEGDYKYIVLEYCEHGDLRKYLRGYKLSDRQAAYVLSQLVDAVSHMHLQGIMHRDLSTGNVLINSISVHHRTKEELLNVKLTDFGLAAIDQHKTIGDKVTIVGTPGYIAPQVFEEKYNTEADVYSLGAILYVMTSGRAPPDNRTSSRRETSLDFRGVSDPAVELIKRMMCTDHKNRIHLIDIKNSDFMRQNREVNPRSASRPDRPSKDSGHGSLPFADSNEPLRLRDNSREPPTRYREEAPLTGRQFLARRTLSREREEVCGRQPLAVRHNVASASNSCRHSRVDQTGRCSCGRDFPPRERSRCPSYLNTGTCGGRCAQPPRRLSLERDVERRSQDRRSLRTASIAAEPPPPRPVWPLVTDRIGAQVEMFEAGRFRLNEDRSVVAELVDSGGVVSTIMTVRSTLRKGRVTQTVTICKPYQAVKLDGLSTEPVAADEETAESFESLEELPTRVLKHYRRVALFIKKLGGKVVKVKRYHPRFPDASCKVMENGDFHLCLKDGRVAVQRVDSREVKVSVVQGDAECRLTETEMRIFDEVRKDTIEFVHAIERFPGVFPILQAGTPSPSRSPRVDSRASNRMSSTPLSRPAPARSSSVRRNSALANKENVAPRCSVTNDGIVTEMRDGAIAWVKCRRTGNRLRISQEKAGELVYRLADGSQQRLEAVSKSKPACAEEMFQFLLQTVESQVTPLD